MAITISAATGAGAGNLCVSLLGVILRGRFAPERVLVLGCGGETSAVVAHLQRTPGDHLLLDWVETATAFADARAGDASGSQLGAILERRRPDRVIVGSSITAEAVTIADLIRARLHHVNVETAAEASQRLVGKLAIETMTPLSLAGAAAPRRRLAKRVISLAAASLGLLLVSPLLVVIAVLIKLDSPGPVLFVQERIGLGGRRFRLFKFRSMRPAPEATSVWERDHVERITAVGAWLRRYHLDELPQFLNIVRGDMDLVGPRPHPVSNHQLFEREIPHYGLRCEVRPGLTGWAQVRHGYANDLAAEVEKMRYDLFYLTHQSSALDVWIVGETLRILVVGRRRGATLAIGDSRASSLR